MQYDSPSRVVLNTLVNRSFATATLLRSDACVVISRHSSEWAEWGWELVAGGRRHERPLSIGEGASSREQQPGPLRAPTVALLLLASAFRLAGLVTSSEGG